MKRNKYSVIIFSSLFLNVIMLQLTTKNYLESNTTPVLIFSSIAVLSALMATFAFLRWRKVEKAQYES